MRLAHFDCFNGASGDMILGALTDAGLDLDKLRDGLGRLDLSGYAIETERVKRSGIAGTCFRVVTDTDEKTPRHLSDILKLIGMSDLSDHVKTDSEKVFRRLAEVEAAMHDTDVESVHFHEVGAVDSIVDVVGTCIALEELGIEQVTSAPLPTGTGFVDCAHGRLPVPAPATAKLLEGFPVAASEIEAELTTPTGAALLTTLAERFGPRPAMTVGVTGFGAGSRELAGTPNLLRVFIGETALTDETDRMRVLETNIDDMSGELFELLFERLFSVGAVDVFTTPIQMKKGRPAVKLSVIVSEELRSAAEDIIFRETTTFGIRSYVVDRRKLARESVDVETAFGTVSVKLGRLDGELITVSPEYDDCRRLASDAGVALKDVYEKARQAAAKLT